jgi:threonine dehydrogenase-like Zn-dependent dehydrogenase
MSNNTMKAAVYLEPRRLSVEQVAVPEAGPADVLIRVHACGICGSDIHSYKHGKYIEPGQIMGHEFMGTAAVVGSAVSGVHEGDRVTGFTLGTCGHCYWCERRQWVLCPQLFKASTGYGRPGAFAEYVLISNAVPGRTIHHVPDNVDDVSAATIEPVGVGIHAVQVAEVKVGDRVVVLGAGMIGNACLQAAKAAGASVYVVDVSPARLTLASQRGADAVFDARSGDPLEWVKQAIGPGAYHFNEGGMADVVFEAAGVAQTIQGAFEMVRSGGAICFVGLPEGAVPIDTTKIVHKLPRIVGALGSNFEAAIEGLSTGRIRTTQLVTHQFTLNEVREAFETQLRAGDAVKVMVTAMA